MQLALRPLASAEQQAKGKPRKASSWELLLMSEGPRMKQNSLNSRLLQSQGIWEPQEHGISLSFRPWPAAPTLSFLTLVQGSLEKLSVSEISMSSPYRTPVRSFLTCHKEKVEAGCAGGHRKAGSERSSSGSGSNG